MGVKVVMTGGYSFFPANENEMVLFFQGGTLAYNGKVLLKVDQGVPFQFQRVDFVLSPATRFSCKKFDDLNKETPSMRSPNHMRKAGGYPVMAGYNGALFFSTGGQLYATGTFTEPGGDFKLVMEFPPKSSLTVYVNGKKVQELPTDGKEIFEFTCSGSLPKAVAYADSMLYKNSTKNGEPEQPPYTNPGWP